MINLYLLELTVNIFLLVLLFICVFVNVYIIRRLGKITNENIIPAYNLARLSCVSVFALCFLIGFIFAQKNWLFLPLMIFTVVGLLTSNISFIVSHKNLYEEAKRKQKLSEDSILDQDI